MAAVYSDLPTKIVNRCQQRLNDSPEMNRPYLGHKKAAKRYEQAKLKTEILMNKIRQLKEDLVDSQFSISPKELKAELVRLLLSSKELAEWLGDKKYNDYDPSALNDILSDLGCSNETKTVIDDTLNQLCTAVDMKKSYNSNCHQDIHSQKSTSSNNDKKGSKDFSQNQQMWKSYEGDDNDEDYEQANENDSNNSQSINLEMVSM
ncbi:MAG: hypothetical protein GY821_09790 [Gammaproteobacteria bacterium]|nr:hypothetical protein [Gammaproteobacteria bacterium]